MINYRKTKATTRLKPVHEMLHLVQKDFEVFW